MYKRERSLPGKSKREFRARSVRAGTGKAMFGYIVPCKKQLGEADSKIFGSYYCGLCKAMGRQCSQLSRLGLSYDASFLAMVLSAVTGEEHEEREERCIVHPLKKRPCIKRDTSVDYAACTGVMLMYLKLLDDVRDEHSIKALFAMSLMSGGARRARKRYPDEYAYIKKCLDELSAVESENDYDIDRAADCFARILQRLFTPDFITDKNTRRALDWFGYNIGRWIFVLDAVNDLEKDYRNHEYNPLLGDFDGGDISAYREKCAKELEVSLTYTLGNAASSFELIDIKRNGSVLGAMIYDSLRLKQQAVLNKGDNNGSI